jgi:hypothetical protein
MGSPRTRDSRGAVIVPLRPDVNVEIEEDRRRTSARESTAKATHERRGGPEQLSLFDEPHDR